MEETRQPSQKEKMSVSVDGVRHCCRQRQVDRFAGGVILYSYSNRGPSIFSAQRIDRIQLQQKCSLFLSRCGAASLVTDDSMDVRKKKKIELLSHDSKTKGDSIKIVFFCFILKKKTRLGKAKIIIIIKRKLKLKREGRGESSSNNIQIGHGSVRSCSLA